MEQQKKVTTSTLLSYGIGDLYGGGSFLIISMLFIYFLTDVVGMNVSLAGFVVLVGKVWDAIIDPTIGYVTDHMKSRFGRRRIFFLFAIIPIALSFFLLWMPFRSEHMAAIFAYYLFAYIFNCTVFSIVMIPYSALNAEIVEDYKTRTRLSGARMMFSQLSALIAGVVPKILIHKFPSESQGFLVMGLVFGIFYALPWLIVFLGTWEMPVTEKEEAHSSRPTMDFLKSMVFLFKNRSFKIHMLMYLLAYAALDILMAMFVYYLNYYIGRPKMFSACLGSMLIAQLSMLPVYVAIANRAGKGKAYIIGLSIWAAAMALSMFLTPSTPLFLLVLLCVMIGVGMSAGTMIPWAILPSITDVDEMITTQRRAGIYAGIMSFIRQLVQAVTLFAFSQALFFIGYVANTKQSPETLFKLKTMFFLAPFILIVCGIIVAFKFGITPQTHAVLMKEIHRLKEGGAMADVTPETRQVCETLTGQPYEKLYKKWD